MMMYVKAFQEDFRIQEGSIPLPHQLKVNLYDKVSKTILNSVFLPHLLGCKTSVTQEMSTPAPYFKEEINIILRFSTP